MLRVIFATLALCFATTATAATYNLSYRFDATVSKVTDFIQTTNNPSTPLYPSLTLGVVVQGIFDISFDTTPQGYQIISKNCFLGPAYCNYSGHYIQSFDPKTGAIDYRAGGASSDTGVAIGPFGGTAFSNEERSNGLDFRIVDFTLSNVTVTGLPSVVPLPATLPFLGIGIVALGWFGRPRAQQFRRRQLSSAGSNGPSL